MTNAERELLIMLAASAAARYQSEALFAISGLFVEAAERVAAEIEDAALRQKVTRTFSLILGRDPNV
jgi:hypothetical protein